MPAEPHVCLNHEKKLNTQIKSFYRVFKIAPQSEKWQEEKEYKVLK